MTNFNPTRIEKFYGDNISAYLDILKNWVAINSFTANGPGVDRLGDVTVEPFEELGFSVRRVPSTNPSYGQHLVLSRAGSGKDAVGLVSHLDTVFPEGEEQDNSFEWRIEADRVYGPGTVDIKGGTLLILMLLDALREFEPELFESTTWRVLLDASEETMSVDFGELCNRELAGARACLIFEGGFYDEDTFKLVQMRKGMAKFRIRVDGKAAHAGVAHADGVNAIVQLAETVRSVAGFTDYDQNITFNVGSIQGGTVPNRVPHFAEAIGEMRAFDKAVFDEGVAKLKALESDKRVMNANGSACRIDVDVFEVTRPWSRNEATDGLIEIWNRAAQELGWRVLPEARGGLSDGNHTWDMIPTVDGLGPGGGNAHCSVHDPANGIEQEYLFLPSLLPKAVLNYLAVCTMLKQREV